MELLTIALICLGEVAVIDAVWKPIGVPGVPDQRDLNVKVSRGSGMGVIHPGYILLVLLAFAFFVVVFWMIVFYKRHRDREDTKTLFLTTY